VTESQQSQTAKGLPPEGTGGETTGEAVNKKAKIHPGLGAMEFSDSLFRSRRGAGSHSPGYQRA
jgi:hypothetical protein